MMVMRSGPSGLAMNACGSIGAHRCAEVPKRLLHDEIGLEEPLLDVAVHQQEGIVAMGQHLVTPAPLALALLVDHWGARLQSLSGVEDGRQPLVLHSDPFHRLLGDLLGLGRHESNYLAAVPHLVIGEHRLVGDDESVDVVRRIFGRCYRLDPRQPLGRARVELDDTGVVLGAQEWLWRRACRAGRGRWCTRLCRSPAHGRRPWDDASRLL